MKESACVILKTRGIRETSVKVEMALCDNIATKYYKGNLHPIIDLTVNVLIVLSNDQSKYKKPVLQVC